MGYPLYLSGCCDVTQMAYQGVANRLPQCACLSPFPFPSAHNFALCALGSGSCHGDWLGPGVVSWYRCHGDSGPEFAFRGRGGWGRGHAPTPQQTPRKLLHAHSDRGHWHRPPAADRQTAHWARWVTPSSDFHSCMHDWCWAQTALVSFKTICGAADWMNHKLHAGSCLISILLMQHLVVCLSSQHWEYC